MAAILPFLLLAVALLWFGAYAVYCEMVRGVDSAIGDEMRVPLSNGYSLCMIDTPAQAFIITGRCSGVALVDGVRQLATTDDSVVGPAVRRRDSCSIRERAP